jgi:hypothetical protein
LIVKWDFSSGSEGGFRIIGENSGQNFKFEIGDDHASFPDDSVTSTSTINDDEWHHLVAVRNGNENIQIYIDGELEATDDSLTTTGSIVNTDALRLQCGESALPYVLPTLPPLPSPPVPAEPAPPLYPPPKLENYTNGNQNQSVTGTWMTRVPQ